MAAHPFGPIETFLLRSSKKMGFDPIKISPVFEEQRTKSFNINSPPYWLFQPLDIGTYELERTAIVNSSEYDVLGEFCYADMDLLSRGLGYRITFTMPADREFQIHDQSTWPGLEFQLLDLFGEKILQTASIPQGHPMTKFKDLAPEIARMNIQSSIEVEFTVEHFRVTVDNLHQILVPLYFPLRMSRSIDDNIYKYAPFLCTRQRNSRDSYVKTSSQRLEVLR